MGRGNHPNPGHAAVSSAANRFYFTFVFSYFVSTRIDFTFKITGFPAHINEFLFQIAVIFALTQNDSLRETLDLILLHNMLQQKSKIMCF